MPKLSVAAHFSLWLAPHKGLALLVESVGGGGKVLAAMDSRGRSGGESEVLLTCRFTLRAWFSSSYQI
ncbi:MAG: hypothetical protein KME15_00025 [Drouetiella hepatica Uher 2000/2452]|uniref:Uncharacterized protein n=1 Tax=Drouetiella hepatica Uher 2000/2452 TaxID=904376 RepID=A0A951UKK0_9CYAN|nr:hypothetical protein [Drouetiella hepatica Uher 2000/2452]